MTFPKPLIALVSIAVVGLWGCSFSKDKPLKLSDLKFPDVEKEAIKINRIDTVLLISKSVSLKPFADGSDTIGLKIYDIRGNLLEEDRAQFDGYSATYKYDSLGFVKFKEFWTDCGRRYNVFYHFDSDLLILKQFWTWFKNGNDTCIFKFDKNGRIISSSEYLHENINWGLKTKYEYNVNNLLSKIRFSFVFSKDDSVMIKLNNEKAVYPIENVTSFYYSNNKIDSTVCANIFRPNTKQSYTEKTYYDDLGLRTKTVLMDSLVTTYIYKRRK